MNILVNLDGPQNKMYPKSNLFFCRALQNLSQCVLSTSFASNEKPAVWLIFNRIPQISRLNLRNPCYTIIYLPSGKGLQFFVFISPNIENLTRQCSPSRFTKISMAGTRTACKSKSPKNGKTALKDLVSVRTRNLPEHFSAEMEIRKKSIDCRARYFQRMELRRSTKLSY
jgi:hypothetical protein